MLRTGAPWRDLPGHFGPWSTAYSRFRRWAATGVWQRVLEALYLEPLLNLGRVRRTGTGRLRHRPAVVVGDKGHSYPRVRHLLARRGLRAEIPRRSDQRPLDRRHRFDPALYPERNRVERLVGRLKQFRRIATRYEKRATCYLAFLTLAAILLWL